MTTDDTFTPIGDIARHIVAQSVLTNVSEDWKALKLHPPEWSGYISLEQGRLVLIHTSSLTHSKVQFDARNVITSINVLWTDNNQPCDDGHWVRIHGLMAERILRTQSRG